MFARVEFPRDPKNRRGLFAPTVEPLRGHGTFRQPCENMRSVVLDLELLPDESLPDDAAEVGRRALQIICESSPGYAVVGSGA